MTYKSSVLVIVGIFTVIASILVINYTNFSISGNIEYINLGGTSNSANIYVVVMGDKSFNEYLVSSFKSLGLKTSSISEFSEYKKYLFESQKINILLIQGSLFEKYYNDDSFRMFIKELAESRTMIYVYGKEASLLFSMLNDLGVSSFPREVSVKVGAGYIKYNSVYESVIYGANPVDILNHYYMVLEEGGSLL